MRDKLLPLSIILFAICFTLRIGVAQEVVVGEDFAVLVVFVRHSLGDWRDRGFVGHKDTTSSCPKQDDQSELAHRHVLA